MVRAQPPRASHLSSTRCLSDARTVAEHKASSAPDWFVDQGQAYQPASDEAANAVPMRLLIASLHCWLGSTRSLSLDGNYPWTEDEILTWISIYWFSTKLGRMRISGSIMGAQSDGEGTK